MVTFLVRAPRTLLVAAIVGADVECRVPPYCSRRNAVIPPHWTFAACQGGGDDADTFFPISTTQEPA